MWGYHDKNVVLNKGEIFYTMEHMAGFHVRNTSLSSRDHSMGPTLQGGSSNAKSYGNFDGFSLGALGGLVI